MDVKTAIRERRSIRKFRSEEVPQDIIREILEEARWAPSWGNTQAWEFLVVAGKKLERFQQANCVEKLEKVYVTKVQSSTGQLKTTYQSTFQALSTGRLVSKYGFSAKTTILGSICSRMQQK